MLMSPLSISVARFTVGSERPRKISHIDMDAFYASVEQRAIQNLG